MFFIGYLNAYRFAEYAVKRGEVKGYIIKHRSRVFKGSWEQGYHVIFY